jgi:quinol-cytochrome oxidoreductase complex cytochrome b subunit
LLGNGEDVTPLTLGDTIRVAHPKIIGGAFFFFLLGGQGGLVLLDAQDKNILESPHAMTAVLSVVLLACQALLPKLFATENGALARNVHAYLGTATMAVLFAHMATGINLGLSF